MSDPLPNVHATMNAADTALVARIRAGDAAAFTELVDACAEAGVRLAYRFLGSRDVALDIVQTVLADWWTRREVVMPRHSLRAYFLGAVRLQALKELRRHDRRSGHISLDVDHSDDVAEFAADHVMRDTETTVSDHLTVEALMAKLSGGRRTALQLRYLEQLSYAEIAQIMEISVKAAEQLVLRALADLRRLTR